MVRTVMVDWSLLDRKPLFKAERYKKKASVKAFIQARTTSTRFPGKIYQEINGAPMLYHTVSIAKECRLIDEVVIVSPHELPEVPEGIPLFVWDGAENDVLGRYAAALRKHPAEYVVRLTSDCPLLDHNLIDFIIATTVGWEADYGSNVLTATFPDGLDTEVISASTLRWLDTIATDSMDREHVTWMLRNDPTVQVERDMVSVQAFQDQSSVKLSVDTEEDLARVRAMEKALCQR